MKQRIPAKIVSLDGKPSPKLSPMDRRNLDNLMKSLDGKDVWISIEKQTRQRSNLQNKYLWGVVYSIIADETGMDAESVHNFGKNEFLKRDTDGLIAEVRSTKKLTTVEFMAYYENLIRWAAEFLSVYIPLPQEEEMWSSVLDGEAKNG